MKNKLNVSPQLTNKISVKQTITYAAGSIALFALLFTGAFFYLNLGNSEDAVAGNNEGFEFSISSTDGYDIKIQMQIVKVIVPSSCPNGYNYDFQVDYNITYLGNNIPSNMWTLQANIIFDNQKLWFDIPTNAKGAGTIITTQKPSTTKTDCATVTLESFNCRNIELLIQGSGISTQTVMGNPIILPIVLENFQASLAPNSTVQVEWSTFSEKNNDFFTLERSADGKNFEVLATIDGAGNSNKKLSYSFEDKNPLTGYNYYRLKQTDFNGDFEYFKIVGINNDREAVSKTATLQVSNTWPNPFRDHVNITFDANTDGEAELLIQNALGQVVHKTLFPFHNGENTYAFEEGHRLKSGVYIISLWKNGKKYNTQKLVKM